MSTFAERLNRARDEAGVNWSELARAVGVRKQAAQAWKDGSAKAATPANLIALARFLRVRIEWLGIGEEPMRPTPIQAEFDALDAPRQQQLLEIARSMRVASDVLRDQGNNSNKNLSHGHNLSSPPKRPTPVRPARATGHLDK